MKRDLLKVVRTMYRDLGSQYTALEIIGNGRIVHEVTNARTVINGNHEIVNKALRKKVLPRCMTMDYICDLLRTFEEYEINLVNTQKKLIYADKGRAGRKVYKGTKR